MEIETTKKEDDQQNGHNGHFNRNAWKSGDDNRFRSDSLRIEFESPGFNMMRGQLGGEMEPLVLNGDNSNSQGKDFVLLKSEIFCIENELT